jgi:hypothetical protein
MGVIAAAGTARLYHIMHESAMGVYEKSGFGEQQQMRSRDQRRVL